MDIYKILGGGRDNRMTAKRAHRRAGIVVAVSVVVSGLGAGLVLLLLSNPWDDPWSGPGEWIGTVAALGGLHLLASLPTVLFGIAYLLVGLRRDGSREIGGSTAGLIWVVAGVWVLATVALETVFLGFAFAWESTGEAWDFGGIAWRAHLLIAIPTMLAAVLCVVNGLLWWSRPAGDNRVTARREHRRAGLIVAGAVLVGAVWSVVLFLWMTDSWEDLRDTSSSSRYGLYGRFILGHLQDSIPTILFGVAYLLAGLRSEARREISGDTAGLIWLIAGGGALAAFVLEPVILILIRGGGGFEFFFSGFFWGRYLLNGIPALLVIVGCAAYGLLLRYRHQLAVDAEGTGAGEA